MIDYETYYPQYNKNTGRVKEVTETDVLANIAKSWGVGDIRLPLSACKGFIPKVDDRVLLCYDEETGGGKHGGRVFTKMKKTRWPPLTK